MSFFDLFRRRQRTTTLFTANEDQTAGAAGTKNTAAVRPRLRGASSAANHVPKETGTVKWFNSAKGYGFVQRSSGEDVFVHFSAIQTSGYRNLEEGQTVEFRVTKGPKGLQCTDVVLVGDRKPDELPNDEVSVNPEYVALGVFGGKVRLLSISPDGTYTFLDEAANVHNILYVCSSETRALEYAVEEMESLMNSKNTKESDLQEFFERNPDFVKTDEYKQAHPQVVLTRDDDGPLKPDFVLEPLDQGRLCDLLELKLPSAQIFVLKDNRQRFSAAVLEACAQLREYSLYFDDPKHRELVRQTYGLLAYRPRLFVIIGRTGSVSPIDLRKMELDLPHLQLRTYDDVAVRMRSKLAAMKDGKWRCQTMRESSL